MPSLTATLTCPHERGKDTHGAERVASVAFDEDGGGRQDHLKGAVRENRCDLPAGETDSQDKLRKVLNGLS
jgi:hypothetical protein